MALKTYQLNIMAINILQLVRGLLVLTFAGILIACGGGGITPVTDVTVTPGGMRSLPSDFTTRKAVSYSPYRTAKDVNDRANEIITDAMVKQDLELLSAAGFGLIRLFDSSEKVAERTLRVIRVNNLDIKVMLGIYIQNGDEQFNEDEKARGVALANIYRDIVQAVSVGNETMVYWSFNRVDPTTMAAHLKSVRARVTQPVTTDDNWAFYADAPRSVLDTIDFASVHTYPELDTVFNPTLWDWRQASVPASQRATAMIDAAIERAKFEYNTVRAYLSSRNASTMPIIIGETGWNAVDVGALKFRAHPVNQKMYYDRLTAWANEGKTGAGPKAIFYFEAFDEPWKGGDDKWGLFNVARQARYVIQGDSTKGLAYEPVASTDRDGIYTADDAVYYTPPVVNPAITQPRYTIHADKRVPGLEFRADDLFPDLLYAAFDGTTADYPTVMTDSAPDDSGSSIEIRPNPKDYGWGLLFFSASARTENLSSFTTLNFSVKTFYQGKIEVGVSSESDLNGMPEAYIQISSGQYGYCNTGNWCKVSIPIQAFLSANPKLDTRLVLSRFIIADRFAFTGNTVKTGLPKINVDEIYWAR
jgi:exo-beta-1,3-glucanase (GH17 family)